MYRFYNPNPYYLDTGDCVIRALSKLLNISWDEAFVQLSIQAYKMKRIMTDNITWGSFLKERGYSKEILSETKTVNEFCNQFDTGKYALATGSHVVAAINGDYFDSWDSGNGGTVGEVSLTIAINGEALATSTMISTPAAIGDFNNISRTETITVPNGCCLTISIKNTSDQNVTVQNATINITRVA